MLDFIKGIWADFVEFMGDLLLLALDGFLGGVAAVLESLPVPDFMAGKSLGSILGPAFSEIGYFMAQASIDDCLSMVTAAVTFRLFRKLLTLGWW